MPDVVVVGGGITGLVAAREAGKRGDTVTVLEASDRLGGKISTREFAGVPVEDGPDTFLARIPWAVALCREVGLGDDLVAPATGQAYIWSRGALRPLPEGTVLGVPASFAPVVRSGLLSPAGMARAALDVVLPRTPVDGDRSIADVVGRRLGSEVVDRLVEPLLGGINAGRADRLSLAATAPDVAAVAARHRSLVLGLRETRRQRAASPDPVFLSVRGGLERLADRLSCVPARCGVTVRAIDKTDAGRYVVRCRPGPDVHADRVIVTTPAHATAPLLPAVARDLAGIDHASVAVVTLAYRRPDVAHPLDGSGFLVPRVEGRLLTASTWLSSKWPDLARSGLVLVRASAGRAGDDRAMELDDEELVDALHRDLAQAVGLRGRPVETRVVRWTRGFPQYDVGHQARVERIRSTLAREMPGVVVAGAAYGGLGLAACVRQGQEAAAA